MIIAAGYNDGVPRISKFYKVGMNQTEIIRIVRARLVHDYVVELEFNDGYVSQIDLRPQLWGPVFGPLLDESLFSQFRLEDDTIRWPSGADFCPDVLRYWCEAGGVQSQEVTDRYFTGLTLNSASDLPSAR
jgi:hypothetical protein